MNRTHVSYDGFMQRVVNVVHSRNDLPCGVFVAFGRLVNPNGSYDNAPRVSLYVTQDGCVALDC